MVEFWAPKSGVPATFSLGEAFGALITGDPAWAWLGAYLPYLGESQFETAPFCAAGPSSTTELGLVDFLTANRNPLAAIIDKIDLIRKLRNVAYDRIFGAYCEFHSDTGETCTVFATPTANLGDGRQFVLTPFWAIPAGVQKMRLKVISWGTGTNDVHLVGYASGSNIANPSPDSHSFHAVGYESFHTWTAALTHIGAYSNAVGSVFEFSWCSPGTLVPHVPDEHDEPPDLIPPATRSYPDLDAIGAELDRQEFKLDLVIEYLRFLAQIATLPPGESDDEEPLEDGVPLAIANLAGVCVILSGIPAAVSEDFGVPPRLHNAGRLTLGTVDGFLPSYEIEHSPFVIQPLPPGVESITANLTPPITATVIRLKQTV